MDQPFFKTIDWKALEKRQIEPPFKPEVVSIFFQKSKKKENLNLNLISQRHPLDTQYFDKAFTRERVRLTPIEKTILQSMDQQQFQGFSYTNPNATL